MNELLPLILKFVQQIEKNIDQLTEEESSELNDVLKLSGQFINNQLSRQTQQPSLSPFLNNPAIPSSARLLWILSGGQEDAFINYLRTFPDRNLTLLLRNPEKIQDVIENLRVTMPQEERPIEQGIQQAPLNSSNIFGFNYDPRSGKLLVRFQSGSVYKYDNVPAGIFKIFQEGAVPAKTQGKNQFGRWWIGKIPSLGAAFYDLIREGGFAFQKVS